MKRLGRIIGFIVLVQSILCLYATQVIADRLSQDKAWNSVSIKAVSSGEEVTLQEISSGKYLLVYFWDPSDGDCKQEWKQVSRFAAASPSQALKAVAVYPSGSDDSAISWLSKIGDALGCKTLLYAEDKTLYKSLSNQKTLPYLLYIDPSGLVLSTRSGFGSDLAKWLQKLPEPKKPGEVVVKCKTGSGQEIAGTKLKIGTVSALSGSTVTLPSGKSVSIDLDNNSFYEAEKMEITPEAGKQQVVELELVRRKGQLIADSKPEGAILKLTPTPDAEDSSWNAPEPITCDGKAHDIECGKYKISVEMPGYRTQTFDVTIEGDKVAQMPAVQLEKDTPAITVALGGAGIENSLRPIPFELMQTCAEKVSDALKTHGYEVALVPAKISDPTVPSDTVIATADPVIIESRNRKANDSGYWLYVNLRMGKKGSARPRAWFTGSYFPLKSVDNNELSKASLSALDEMLEPALEQFKLISNKPSDIQWKTGDMNSGISGKSKMSGEDRDTEFHGHIEHLTFTKEDEGKTLLINTEAGQHLMRAEIWPGHVDRGDHKWWERHDPKQVVFSAGNFEHVVVSNSPTFTWTIAPGSYTLFFCHYIGRHCRCSDKNFLIKYTTKIID